MLFSTFLSAQTIPYEKLSDHHLSDQKIDQLSELSKNHVLKSAENQITKDELELVDVEVVFENEPVILTGEPATIALTRTHSFASLSIKARFKALLKM